MLTEIRTIKSTDTSKKNNQNTRKCLRCAGCQKCSNQRSSRFEIQVLLRNMSAVEYKNSPVKVDSPVVLPVSNQQKPISQPGDDSLRQSVFDKILRESASYMFDDDIQRPPLVTKSTNLISRSISSTSKGQVHIERYLKRNIQDRLVPIPAAESRTDRISIESQALLPLVSKLKCGTKVFKSNPTSMNPSPSGPITVIPTCKSLSVPAHVTPPKHPTAAEFTTRPMESIIIDLKEEGPLKKAYEYLCTIEQEFPSGLSLPPFESLGRVSNTTRSYEEFLEKVLVFLAFKL